MAAVLCRVQMAWGAVMGQGAEDAGGYELTYEPHVEAFERGMLAQLNGVDIKIRDMSLIHLKRAKRIADSKRQFALFSHDGDVWGDIADALEIEISRRPFSDINPTINKAPPKPVRGARQTMICHCGCEYQARVADLKRGWALSCDKHCAAVRRDYGRPAAKQKKEVL